MCSNIKMSTQKKNNLSFYSPVLHGSISTAMAKCGQRNCRCQKDAKALHGPYYRWTGVINGIRTTRTITKKNAQECQRWIKNYNKLQKQIEKLIAQTLDSAPWQT